MKSVKPGRGPSMMGCVGNIIAAVLGVIWIASASSMEADGSFIAFGVVFVILALVGAIYNYINATGKKRFSAYDITDANEEPDPLNERLGDESSPDGIAPSEETFFCPYCGQKAEPDHKFCKKCGRVLRND